MSEANRENEAERVLLFGIFFIGESFESKEMTHFPPANNCLLFASSFSFFIFSTVFLYLMVYFIVWRNGSIGMIASVSLTVHYR